MAQANIGMSEKPRKEDNNVDPFDTSRDPFCDDLGNRRGRFDVLLSPFLPFTGRRSRVAATAGPAALFLIALLIAMMAGGGSASARDYGLMAMNFDLWCQEAAGLPVDRCDQRTAADEKAFEDFQQEIGPYEAQNLRNAQQEQWLEQDFIQNDPIDSPVMPSSLPSPQSSLPRRVTGQ